MCPPRVRELGEYSHVICFNINVNAFCFCYFRSCSVIYLSCSLLLIEVSVECLCILLQHRACSMFFFGCWSYSLSVGAHTIHTCLHLLDGLFYVER